MSGAYCGVLVFARFLCHVLWCNGALVPGCHVPRCSGVMWAWCKLKPAVNSQPSLASPHLESSTTCDSGDQTLTVNKQIGSHWNTCSPPPWSSEDASHLVISQTVFKMSSMPIIVRQHASWNIFQWQCQLLLFSDPTLHSLLLPSAVERNRWCHRGIRGGHISVSLRWTNLQSMTVLLHSVERIRSYVLVIRGLSCPFASQGFVCPQ